MKRQLCLLILCTPLLMMAQSFDSAQDDSTKGIKWTTGLSWEQVKAKAKAENKYIFLDCFTTWCGPCKMMDEYVYPNDTVGRFFNDRFISIKVQMDKTKNDNENVKRWYEDAVAVGKEYHVYAFPTFVYLTPAGMLVEQRTGFAESKTFLSVAEEATKPGKVYIYKQYDDLMSAYNKGEKNYEKYPYMIKYADLRRDTISKQLRKELIEHMSRLRRNKRYTKDWMIALDSRTYTSNSSIYKFYFNDGRLIDKVMGEKNYSQRRIDQTIQAELVVPFFKEQNKNPNLPMTGMYLNGFESDYIEADWKLLTQLIRKKYNKSIVKRNVLAARIEWYDRHLNYDAGCRYKLIQLKQYPPGNLDKDAASINQHAWNAFQFLTDRNLLNDFAEWMEKLVAPYPNGYAAFRDTRANLLYKIGEVSKAIEEEENAIKIASNLGDKHDASMYADVLIKMKSGQPTYGVSPLVVKK